MLRSLKNKLIKKIEYHLLLNELLRESEGHLRQGVHLNKNLHEKFSEFTSASTLAGTMREFKLNELQHILQNIQPKSILELGGGCTTFLFLEYYLNSIEKPKILSVDESEQWSQHLRRSLGDLAGNIEFHVEARKTSHSGVFYDNLIELLNGIIPEFVYVDGPSCEPVAKNTFGKSACIDIINLVENGILPKYILVDMRYDSVEAFLNTNYAREFKIKSNYRMLESSQYSKISCQYHTILEKI